ncbi:hypothetical protein FACS1894166_01320 [Bacilli bacterium]|nr:hypothetical protein FACS1894166_01320 [Bacilli bacterium]
MKKIVRPEHEISRSSYIDEIVRYKDKDLIKVITGIRRSGKSVILQQYYDLLTTVFKIKRSHIFYINFDDSNNNVLKENQNLAKTLKQFISLNKGNKYVLLDEIQDVNNFEEIILNLYQHKEVDIYLTGSNATLNSKQIATKFVGRSVKIEISPFSFTEMVEYNKKNSSSLKTNEELFDEYRKYGGMPVILSLRSD